MVMFRVYVYLPEDTIWRMSRFNDEYDELWKIYRRYERITSKPFETSWIKNTLLHLAPKGPLICGKERRKTQRPSIFELATVRKVSWSHRTQGHHGTYTALGTHLPLSHQSWASPFERRSKDSKVILQICSICSILGRSGDGSKPYPPVVHIKIAGIYGCSSP